MKWNDNLFNILSYNEALLYELNIVKLSNELWLLSKTLNTLNKCRHHSTVPMVSTQGAIAEEGG